MKKFEINIDLLKQLLQQNHIITAANIKLPNRIRNFVKPNIDKSTSNNNNQPIHNKDTKPYFSQEDLDILESQGYNFKLNNDIEESNNNKTLNNNSNSDISYNNSNDNNNFNNNNSFNDDSNDDFEMDFSVFDVDEDNTEADNNTNNISNNIEQNFIDQEWAQYYADKENQSKIEQERQQIDEEIPISTEAIEHANNILQKYNYPPYLKQILNKILALQFQYPRAMLIDDPIDNINKILYQYKLDSADYFFSTSDMKNENVFKNNMIKIFQEQNEQNSTIGKLIHMTIKDIEKYEAHRDTQFRQNDYKITQQKLNNEFLDAYYYFVENKEIKPLQQSEIDNINQLMKDSINKRIKRPENFKNTLIDGGINTIKQYVNGLLKHINKYIYHCVPPNDIYVIPIDEQNKLQALKNMLLNILTECDEYIRPPKYYEKLFKYMNELYGMNYNNILYLTKSKLKKSIKNLNITRSKRWNSLDPNRKHQDEDAKAHKEIKKNNNSDIIERNPTISKNYKKLENYMILDYNNGSDQMTNDGGLFEKETQYLSKYKKRMLKDSTITDNVKTLANKLISELDAFILRPLLRRYIKPFDTTKLVEELLPWYQNHIIFDKEKYCVLLRKICREAFNNFYYDYLSKETK